MRKKMQFCMDTFDSFFFLKTIKFPNIQEIFMVEKFTDFILNFLSQSQEEQQRILKEMKDYIQEETEEPVENEPQKSNEKNNFNSANDN